MADNDAAAVMDRQASPAHDPAPLPISTPAGARAVLIRDPARPVVAVSLRFSAGSARDPAGRSGLAHVLEHMMFAGTRRFGRGGHATMIEAIGGYVNAWTSADWTKYVHVVAHDLFPVFLELEAERLTQTPEAMTEAALAIERDVVLSERRQRMESHPYGTAIETLVSALYPADSPYHRLPIGAVQDVRRIGLSDCLAFHAENYTAARVNLAVVGDLHPEDAASRVAALLDVLNPMTGAPGPAAAASTLPQTRRIEVRSSFRPKIFIGCLLPTAASWDFELARLAGLYLGRGLSARLPDQLIRREQVATAVMVKTMARAADSSAGIIEIVPAGGVRPDELIARLDAAIEQPAGGDLTDVDLQRAKAVYRSSWLADDDTFTGRSDSISLAMQLTGSAGSYLTHDARISTVQLDELRGAVAAWHQPGRRVELIYQT
jgi:predicted Zn-dependent peptidase